MALPDNTGAVLQYLLPAYSSPKAYTAIKLPTGMAIQWHTVPVNERPSESEINTAAASAEFATWLAENGGDPVLTRRKAAIREMLKPDDPKQNALRAFAKVQYKLNLEIYKKLREVMAALKATNTRLTNVADLAAPRTWEQLELEMQNEVSSGAGES